MRKEVPEIGWGDFAVLETGTEAVLAMRYDWRNNSAVFVHNLSGIPREIALEPGLQGPEGATLVNLLAGAHSHASPGGMHRILLEPYGYRWFRAGGLGYILRRSDIDGPAPAGIVSKRRRNGIKR